MKERSDTATKRAIVALEIHKIRADRSAVVSKEGRFECPWRVRTAVVPIATYISAQWVICAPVFHENKLGRLYMQPVVIKGIMSRGLVAFQ